MRSRPPWTLPIALRAVVGHLLDRLCGRDDLPRLLVILVDASAEAGKRSRGGLIATALTELARLPSITVVVASPRTATALSTVRACRRRRLNQRALVSFHRLEYVIFSWDPLQAWNPFWICLQMHGLDGYER
jgi:hypothetical protein